MIEIAIVAWFSIGLLFLLAMCAAAARGEVTPGSR